MACDRDPKRIFIGGRKGDFISDLPSDVLSNIMNRLPLRDAARLCILSKRWNLTWLSLPNLKLDARFFRDVLHNKPFRCYEFNRIVSNIVLSHNGSIPRFILHIPDMEFPPAQNRISGMPGVLLSKSNIRYMCTPEISPVISHLARNGIREIILDNCGNSRLKLPSHLFFCVELEMLTVRGFDIHIPPSFKTFKSVTRIELVNVTLTGRSYSSFISSCPALETLVLKRFQTQDLLVVDAPNLKLLEVEGSFVSFISLKGCLGLSSITIGSKERVFSKNPEKASELVKFLACSCKLQELNLRCFTEFFGHSCLRTMFSNTFDHLRKLQLSSFPLNYKHAVCITIRISQRCPNLEELKISFENTTKAVEHEIFPTKNPFQNLRKVYLTCPTGLNMELKFIKFLLAEAPRLEKLFIPSNVNRTPMQASTLTKNLLSFPRASSKAEILYLDDFP